MKICFALLAATCLLATPALAQSSKDDMSLFPCGAGGLMGDMFCGAYLMGYLHAVQALKPAGVCPPANLSAEQAAEVLNRWVATHPARSLDDLAKRPLDAFASEWPCKR
jgi:hypothetical protein